VCHCRGLWGDERGLANPAPSPELAAWKQQDYNQLARQQAAEAADGAFDAEVGIEAASSSSTPSIPWWRRAWHALTHPVETVQNALPGGRIRQ